MTRAVSSCPGAGLKESHEDVVAVARRRESGITINSIATDFGLGEATLQDWLRQADVEVGNRPGQPAADAAGVRELKKRITLLEQGGELLRRGGLSVAGKPASLRLPKMTYPLSTEVADAGIPVTV